MRNAINTLVCSVLILLSNSAFGNTDPQPVTFTLNETTFTLTVNKDDNNYFKSIEYNELSEKISFNSKATINVVQVLDTNNEVVMFLPIAGEMMHLSIEELAVGDYKVNIILDGVSDIIETNITKK